MIRKILAIIFALLMLLALALPVFAMENEAPAADEASSAAEEESGDKSASAKAIAAAVCVGIVATAGAVSMAMAISKTNDGISRQPEAAGSLRTSLMLGLVFIETAIIYALIVAILIIFVL